jgi:AraC family transcriptional regulator of adaptative response / DNA-3-methyladenine glycosylase II
MTLPLDVPPMLDTSLTDAVCQRACNSRDARFDGLFFVGITTTHIYCRPVCPARVSYPDRRRFFGSPAAAERAGFRPCMRCRPELAPGHALIDAISRLASSAAHRIEAGALNGRSVADLAHELGVSERHLRRALERELGVSPIDLAQTHRLLLAKRLLADTALPVTRVAFVSGFQSLRRFNSLFRERYRLPPSALRRRAIPDRADDGSRPLSLTLSYRAPLAWSAMLERLQRDLTPGVEHIEGSRYGRTIELAGARGIIYVEDGRPTPRRTGRPSPGARGEAHLRVEVSPSLVPVLMPLLARLRRVFDLDAEPRIVDRHLADAGLAPQVAEHPGLRIPGAMDGFEVAAAVLLRGRPWSGVGGRVAQQVVQRLGEPVALGHPALTRISPTAARVAEAGAGELERAGVAARQARAIVQVARALCEQRLHLEAGNDPIAAHHALQAIDGVGERLAKIIVMRALSWPDAFPASDRLLQRRSGLDSATALLDLAEQWRPWRAYAALHLWLGGET